MNPSTHPQPTTGIAGGPFIVEDPRQQRIAERRAFVATKLVFMNAAVDLAGSNAALVTRQVREAKLPCDLWALLPAVLAALPSGATCTLAHAEALARHLESLAPDSDSDTSFVPI